MYLPVVERTSDQAVVPVSDALDSVESLLASLSTNLSSDALSAAEAMGALEQLGRIDRLVTSVRVLIAPALPDDDEFRSTRDHSAKKWLARVSGTSQSAAQSLLAAASGLADMPLVEQAVRSGSLSAPQLGLIADAVDADPNVEADLVAAAATESLFGLQGKADAVKAGVAGNDGERHAKAKKRRRLGMANSRDGLGIDLTAFGPADEAIILLQALRLFMPQMFDDANKNGNRPSYEAMQWDALIALARAALGQTPWPTSGGRGTKVIVRVDYEALVRRFLHPGETCDLVGVGPIPVTAAADLIAQGNVFLAAVITDAERVAGVVHFGRRPNAAQITALEWMNPKCVVEGCDTTIMDWDHEVDWDIVLETEITNIVGICPPDHGLKTHHNWRLAQGTGRRPLLPPGHPDHPGDPHHNNN